MFIIVYVVLYIYEFVCLTNTGVNLSLLSRVMSSRLARGTYNGGLLSTEAGTLARVVADGTITLAGYLGEDKLLNVTLLPSLLICVASIIATFFTYNTLYWSWKISPLPHSLFHQCFFCPFVICWYLIHIFCRIQSGYVYKPHILAPFLICLDSSVNSVLIQEMFC